MIGLNIFLVSIISLIIIIIIYLINYILNTNDTNDNFTNINKNNLDERPQFPIDIVYTWAGENNDKNDIRVSYNDELKYGLRGIEKNLKWVNKIYILMNPPKQIPSWFKKDYDKDKIVLLDHYDTFKDKKYLPTKHSKSIESTLHNIPGLSEHFIYFNDDFFITKKLPYTHFFTPNGKPILTQQFNNRVSQKHNFPTTIKGFYAHIPFPILKSQMIKFEKINPNFMDFVRKIKKRNREGCDVCINNGLQCPCLQIQGTLGIFMKDNGVVEIKNFNENSGYYFQQKNIDKIDINNLQPIIVIQDTDENLETRKINAENTKKILQKIYPNPASYEQ